LPTVHEYKAQADIQNDEVHAGAPLEKLVLLFVHVGAQYPCVLWNLCFCLYTWQASVQHLNGTVDGEAIRDLSRF
jgi:hypothetical protein